MSLTPLISTYSISKSYGSRALFSNISLNFFPNERLGLIGPNGAGKSTLLKILAGVDSPDSGKIIQKNSLFTTYLPQSDQLDPSQTIEEILFTSLPKEAEKSDYTQHIIHITQQAGFTHLNQKVAELSGGWRKKLAISRGLLQKPDLLLMDEPTNHLDLEGVLWLEQVLQTASFAFILISHDRYFLENVTNRIIDLNRQYPEGYLKVEGSYSTFLQQKETIIHQQLQKEEVLSNKVQRELAWLQRGAKARTSKAKFRLDGAEQLKNELKEVQIQNRQSKTATIDFSTTERKTKKLLEAQNISISRGEKILFKNLSLQLSPSQCLGILGRNGSGKTTLIQVLRGDLNPESGQIIRANGLKIVTFDQQREQLNPADTLKRSLCPLGDNILFQGNSIHVTAWAKRFLFSEEKLNLPISQLSGGEQARILIANLMLKPADILLLDEPTNDLDIPTLEVLEENLKEFPGAIILITHDRYFLDRLSDRILYLDGNGKVEFFADYHQWLALNNNQLVKNNNLISNLSNPHVESQEKKIAQGLSYEERKELNRIEQKIAKAEQIITDLQQQLYGSEVKNNSEYLAALHAQIQEAQAQVDQFYCRWEILEARNKDS
ncbi:ribosomal protection-like ABC-F family protein [Candidatus Nitrosacidococcus sp. I8]|uniref:ribosomal protection-like ABC-F family protein n=1 Tax=Candidatus Nitrosacidococcus sp. I8 TaxID=2942908 RepID=UPI0022260418|nr:ABC-F family ATP-binding cassette domain-containing protein [Candidatus Nitrosacidococcus sp. I8]CAH9018995.1 Vitamin B12 import ATP-binding protein BtuD [Candidatus Nitrosacidococcus sp. I8]